MHPGILAARDGRAQERIKAAAEQIAGQLKLDPALIDGLNRRDHDAQITAMYQREGVADLLEALAAQLKPAEITPEEVIPSLESSVTEQQWSAGDDATVTGGDTAAPVIDKQPAAKPGKGARHGK